MHTVEGRSTTCRPLLSDCGQPHQVHAAAKIVFGVAQLCKLCQATARLAQWGWRGGFKRPHAGPQQHARP